tara:strand:+ start:3917 stop:5260 length:1344 start_codon:yes stop_codon:yes gene_type:complete
MSYIENFKGFKKLLEDNNIDYSNFSTINEGLKDLKGMGLEPGGLVKPVFSYPGIKESYGLLLSYIKNPTDSSHQDGIDEAEGSWEDYLRLNKEPFNGYFLGTVPSNWKAINYVALCGAIIAAGKSQGDVKITKKNIYDNSNIDSFTMAKETESNIEAVPAENGIGIAIFGKVNNQASELETKRGQTTDSARNVMQYMNAYNMVQEMLGRTGGNKQYGGEEQVNSDGDLDLRKPGDSAGIVLFTSRLATNRKSSPETSTKSTTEIVGFEPGFEGVVDIAFQQGKAVIPTGDVDKVDALVELILTKFKGKKVDSFVLTSSASPEWAGGETMANYAGKTTTGTGNPGKGDGKFAALNADLAYRRGVALMTAINTKLKAAGHASFPNYVVKWQISDKGGPSGTGRFVDLNIQSNEMKGKEVTTTTTSRTGKVDQKGKIEGLDGMFYAWTFS